MGLFTKRAPCAICGGKVKALLPWKIEGQLVCNACHGYIHVPAGWDDNMTMEQFKAYRAFREGNDVQRQLFTKTQEVRFGLFGGYMQFDTENRLFHMGADLNTTIFEGSCISSFTICEDDEPLYEGSAQGLICYNSTVRARVTEMEPMIRQAAMINQMQERIDRLEEDLPKEQSSTGTVRYNKMRYDDINYYQAIAEPFHKFYVKIHVEHPYWQVLEMDKKGPELSDTDPDINEYLRLYAEDAALMEKLARVLMQVAFPDAPEQRVNRSTAPQPAAPVDAVTELQRYKELLDQGVITEEEFAAMKRKLLGI